MVSTKTESLSALGSCAWANVGKQFGLRRGRRELGILKSKVMVTVVHVTTIKRAVSQSLAIGERGGNISSKLGPVLLG